MPDDSSTPNLAARLREAREYIGLTLQRAAQAAGWHVDRIITLEDGTSEPSEEELATLASLYLRPPGWFRGEIPHQPSAWILAEIERHGGRITQGDIEGMLAFDEFLQNAPPRPAKLSERQRGDVWGRRD
jgi:transcriptional regulator with XRE-family HTH domain